MRKQEKILMSRNIIFKIIVCSIITILLSTSCSNIIVATTNEINNKEQAIQKDNEDTQVNNKKEMNDNEQKTIDANEEVEVQNIKKLQTQNENNDIGKSILVSDTILGEEAKISSAQIIQRKTGIGPFDENDEAGNDSSESNNIVRSFDKITWTVECTMVLKDSSDQKSYRGGVVEVKAELPNTCSNVVKWDLTSMAWAQNATVSADGRIFTAQYQMKTSEVTVPRKQTLGFSLDVLNAQHGLEISPKFTVGLLGNSNDEKYKIENVDAVYVSAAPKYNIVLQNNKALQNNVEVDLGEGKVPRKNVWIWNNARII